jgi:hypothetical protein
VPKLDPDLGCGSVLKSKSGQCLQPINQRVQSGQGYGERCRKRETGIAAEPDAALHPKPRDRQIVASETSKPAQCDP